MEFGFNRELYPTQKRLINDAANLIEQSKVGIFSSPTGTGKTLSLLCAATKFIKVEQDDEIFNILNNSVRTKIYYCSRTHSQLGQALNELKTNRNRYSSVILGSRKVYCVNSKVNCHKNIDVLNDNCKMLIKEDSCQFYRNFHYDQRILDIEDLRKLGQEKTFCPYYFTKNKASECDIVFLPYTLLFNKKSRESLNIDLKDKILIIDEAHNIYDAVIELNSAELRWDELRSISQVKGLSPDLQEILKKLLDFHRTIKDESVFDIIGFLMLAKLGNYNMIEQSDFIDANRLAVKNDMKSIFEFSKMLNLFTFSDDSGRIFVDKYKIRFTTLNPKMYFEDLKECRSILLAGGTMEPIASLKDIFQDVLYFSYPPINENFISLVISESSNGKLLNLNFSQRDLQLENVVNTIITLTNPVIRGGIVIFVPSKYFLLQIKQSKLIQNFRRKVYFDDEISFEEFKSSPEILFSVMGGSLSEGINFSDDICRLLIIVGVPYPTKTLEFEERCKNNADYGSIAAMKTVNQTIGRAIRHKNDYAAVVLLDCRYKNLKTKLSPWVLKKTKEVSLIDGLIRVNNFLKEKK